MLQSVGTGGGHLLEQILAKYWGHNIHFYIEILLGIYIFKPTHCAYWNRNVQCSFHGYAPLFLIEGEKITHDLNIN